MASFCSPPPYSRNPGDLGALCAAELSADGSYGQGSCAAGEVCGFASEFVVVSGISEMSLSKQPYACQVPCNADGTCSQGLCYRNPAAYPSDICVPGCDPTVSDACGTGFACVPLTPNVADPGVCWSACRGDFDCAGAQVCNSRGYCGCTQDTDCYSQACDLPSGICYTPCGAHTPCDAGCCARGPAVDYCEVSAYQAPGSSGTSSSSSSVGSSGGSSGAYGGNAGPNLCVPAPLLKDNGDFGSPCDQSVNNGHGTCDGGEICATLFPNDGGSWGQCTQSCDVRAHAPFH